jgi:hypothetical protein
MVPQPRLLPIGCSDQTSRYRPAVGERRNGRKRRGRDGIDIERRQEREAFQGPDTLEHYASEHPVLDDVAERCRSIEVAIVVMKKERRAVVGDPDLEDWLGIRHDFGPQTEGIKNAAGAMGDRRAAPIEALAKHRSGILAIGDRDTQSGTGTGDAEQ